MIRLIELLWLISQSLLRNWQGLLIVEGKDMTYLQFYEMVEGHIIGLFNYCIRVDVVMDFYHTLSLKNSTREGCGSGKARHLSF